jgi:excisionase family DNA binding protein
LNAHLRWGDFVEKRLLTIREAAEYLGFSVHTIYGWTSQRRIPFVKMGGRLRFDKPTLDRWIEQFALAPIKDPPAFIRK